ncbi:MAG TPA: DNA primase [Candidatus Binatia bacterium]
MIKQDQIVDIRNRASIVEVISDYVTLKKAGRNHVGLCPFHNEKTPSFSVNEEKGIFHCFGCQAGGSVFDFLMRYDHLTFPEAVERVAKRYGITIEKIQSGDPNGRESLYRINEVVARHYQRLLSSHPEGKQALVYLQRRGIEEATVRRFMLGYAPRGGSGLLQALEHEEISPREALRLGFLGERGPNQFYEKFFARVMFPIVNAGGKVVAFGGRIVGEGQPKYLNSSETPLFHKGSTVYGLFQAKDGIRKADRVVLVEGYLDAIALFQHDVDYAVATLGTALTPDHVKLLARYTQNILALFDGDPAGRRAAARSCEIFIEAGMLGRAAFLPQGEDPDTFVRKHGKAAVEAVLERSVPLADYYFSSLQERFGNSLEAKSRIAAEISRLLGKVSSALDADLLAARAVDALGIREDLLRRPLAKPVPTPQAQKRLPQVSPAAVLREDAAERSLVRMLLHSPAAVAAFTREQNARQCIGSEWREVVDLIVAEWQEQGNIDVFRVTQKLSPDRTSDLAALALQEGNLSETECVAMAMDCLTHLRRRHLRTLERNLRVAIRTAEEQKDEKAKRERILEWQDVVREERRLDRRKPEAKTLPR